MSVPSHAAETVKKRGPLVPILMGLGVLLLALALLFPTLIYSGVKKTPLDPTRSESVAEGTGMIFDSATGKLKEYPNMQATRFVSIDTQASDSDVAVFQGTLCIRLTPKKNDDDCDAFDPQVISYTADRAATNRVDGSAVNDPKYFQTENRHNEPDDFDFKGQDYGTHKGLTYKFPFDTTADGKYMMNDGDSGGSVQAKYVATETIEDLEVLHFQAEFPKAETKIKGVFPGTVQNTIDYWVDPTTGIIVKGKQYQEQIFKNGDIAAQVTLTFTDKTVSDNVEKVHASVSKLNLVQIWAPIGSAILGIALIVGGMVLWRKRSTAASA